MTLTIFFCIFQVVPIGLNKLKNEETFKKFEEASGMSIDLSLEDISQSVNAFFGAKGE